MKVLTALTAVEADGVDPDALEMYNVTVPLTFELIFGGNDLNNVEGGRTTVFESLSTLVLMEGDVSMETCRLPLCAFVTTPFRSKLRVYVEFPPPCIDPVPLTVNGPPWDELVYVNPVPVKLDWTILEERFAKLNVRLGADTGEVPLFWKLTFSLIVANPYLSRVYTLFTLIFGAPWAWAGTCIGRIVKTSKSKRRTSAKRFKGVCRRR
jgi:hypothetical protein